eukprot:gnl/TRDRNA2_/TRDRNA2_95042_c0_seq1.p1 gnl/TRDRNA2_/TRDRNA2_95042_c0~~gnl/TRDRNA2_/TRDRNA2_95042_c0_seq1.p1  ORF type:complete len:446 (+),score=98.81 gnl/TRDRNA2_/TRDRNA2_95042_c0_seq1:66-1403(+)
MTSLFPMMWTRPDDTRDAPIYQDMTSRNSNRMSLITKDLAALIPRNWLKRQPLSTGGDVSGPSSPSDTDSPSNWLTGTDGESEANRPPMDGIWAGRATSSPEKLCGHVGLRNLGATCYMNSLLQSLFHIGKFRQLICDVDSGSKPIIRELRKVFRQMESSEQAVGCQQFLEALGQDTFTQQDAQEVSRLLIDKIEEEMKGTPLDGSIKELFEGKTQNYVECCDIEYKSTRDETFYDVQLGIRGEKGEEIQNIQQALREFTAEEMLEGENAYEADGHEGKQRARKGVRFQALPPVLNLHLKRFHFDFERMANEKLNTHFEFQERINLDEFVPNAGTYILTAVIVHSGHGNFGHYYSFIKPAIDGGWFKFDDDTVSSCSREAALDENFGGQGSNGLRTHGAYMLTYIREDAAPAMLRAGLANIQNVEPLEGNRERCDSDRSGLLARL